MNDEGSRCELATSESRRRNPRLGLSCAIAMTKAMLGEPVLGVNS